MAGNRNGTASPQLSSSHLMSRPLIADPSDLLFYAALALLPVDGTVAGIPLPFWTPLAPWLFLAYALVNFRRLRVVARRYLPFALLPLLLMLVSFYGWTTIGFHGWAAARSIGSVVLALGCLASLEIALRVKRLAWKPMVTVLVATYGFAFFVGVVQWAGIRLKIQSIQLFFEKLMFRQYLTAASPWGGLRPQFLFAEPSYIGMHLYGVLLPIYWVIRRRDGTLARNIAWLIGIFALGSLIMGAGVRIILDSLITLVVVIVEATRWCDGRSRSKGIVGLAGVAGLTVIAVALNQRMDSILHSGLDGDGSFSARIWQSLGPLMGMLRRPMTTIFGYGAGNLAQATHDGAGHALVILRELGIPAHKPSLWFRTVNPTSMFTMNAYTSFVVEFGIVGLLMVILAVFMVLTKSHAWCVTTICWLSLVAYLYIQFEGYAFYAIPFMIFVLSRRVNGLQNTNIK